jgi:predicted nucleotidyltransferase
VAALKRWAGRAVRLHLEVVRIGYFGSCARGDWSVGSDLDVVAIVDRAPVRVAERSLGWDTTTLPVPVDLLVYTPGEWAEVSGRGRFGATLTSETVWVTERDRRHEA